MGRPGTNERLGYWVRGGGRGRQPIKGSILRLIPPGPPKLVGHSGTCCIRNRRRRSVPPVSRTIFSVPSFFLGISSLWSKRIARLNRIFFSCARVMDGSERVVGDQFTRGTYRGFRSRRQGEFKKHSDPVCACTLVSPYSDLIWSLFPRYVLYARSLCCGSFLLSL